MNAETKMTDAERAALLLRLLKVSAKVANEALAELAELRARSPAVPQEEDHHEAVSTCRYDISSIRQRQCELAQLASRHFGRSDLPQMNGGTIYLK